MVRARSESDARSVGPMNTWPVVRVSRPARQCISVDLPEPEGPMIAVNRPGGSASVTSSSAVTEVSPVP